MRHALPLLILPALLAACGVDGPPRPPTDEEVEARRTRGTTISISGTAQIGVAGGHTSGTITEGRVSR